MKVLGLAIVLGGVLTAVGCGGKTPAPASEPLPPVRARVARVEQRVIPATVEVSGVVEASQVAAVSSRVMATVTAVPVKAGDAVRAGQVLVEIDPATARGQEAQARGALAQAQAALALAERNWERFRALADRQAASELEVDLARMQYEQARGAVQQAQGAVEAAASVARESRVVAPFAGKVAAKLVEVGDLAAPGRPLVMVESATGRRLSVNVPESASTALTVGAKVQVRIDAMPELGVIEGVIEERAPGADPMTHTVMVKVALTGVEVPAGAAGRASVAVGTRSLVAVPAAALIRHGGLDLVVVRDSRGLARSRAVTLGERLEGEAVTVLSGLSGGEEVLLGLSGAPVDGAPVEEVRS
ncbi:MAG: efflux RND transporter periplasmic adaptor subunit [Acidobacteriota bacterium]